MPTLINRVVFGTLLQWCLADNNDQTAKTKSLNDMLTPGNNGVYSGGKGILIRNINDGLVGNADMKVVPATFLTNDIHSVSIAYPNGNPMCPNNGDSGYNKQQACDEAAGAWKNAAVVAVIGSKMSSFFRNFDNIQDATWGYGVFYATDANSADHRCIYLSQFHGYDCPNYWIDAATGSSSWAPEKKGAGGYPSGNPAQGGGGGSGCHFNPTGYNIDQFDSDQQPNLVSDSNCECNYQFNSDWTKWVDQWMYHGKAKDQFGWMGWFRGDPRTYPAPAWAVDVAACWVNNPRDMINLQNAIWDKRATWSNQMLPISAWQDHQPGSQRIYWGWNEVPVGNVAGNDINDPTNWDALVVKLPAAICADPNGDGGADKIDCLDGTAKNDLKNQLAWYQQNQYLFPGFSFVNKQPGSDVVLLREWQQQAPQGRAGGVWQRWFFCENVVIDSTYKISFTADVNAGYCYVDHSNGPPAPSPPAPPVPPPPASKCEGNVGQFKLQKDTNLCLDVTGGTTDKAGTPIEVWGCNGLPQQNWIWCKDGTIRPAGNTNMCLDVPGGDPTKQNNLQIWNCQDGDDGQLWARDDKSMAIYPSKVGVYNQNSMCMDVEGGLKEGHQVNIYKCTKAGEGEAWITGGAPAPQPPPAPSTCCGPNCVGQFRLSGANNMCLDVQTANGDGKTIAAGAKLQIWPCNNNDNQNFEWCQDGRIVSVLEDKKYCLDIPLGKADQQLQMWDCNGSDNQHWDYDSANEAVYASKIGAPESLFMNTANGQKQKATAVMTHKYTKGKSPKWKVGKPHGNATSIAGLEFVTI